MTRRETPAQIGYRHGRDRQLFLTEDDWTDDSRLRYQDGYLAGVRDRRSLLDKVLYLNDACRDYGLEFEVTTFDMCLYAPSGMMFRTNGRETLVETHEGDDESRQAAAGRLIDQFTLGLKPIPREEMSHG